MKNRLKGRDVIFIRDFSREDIESVLWQAEEMKKNPLKYERAMEGKILVSIFDEDSTRTRLSTSLAMMKLRGVVAPLNLSESSLTKGETLKDTARVIDGYEPDIVTMRHKNPGSVQLLADYIDAPVINSGDGPNQHPTQTFLDLFTIKELRGGMDGLKIALVGDLKLGRTVHSLADALSNYQDCHLHFVSPGGLAMPKPELEFLESKGVAYSEQNLSELSRVVKEVDITYMTRIQRERFPAGQEGDVEYERFSDGYCLTHDMLEGAKPHLKIMHPLPKVQEIEAGIDDGPHAYYFEQAANGIHVRKSLLYLLTHDE